MPEDNIDPTKIPFNTLNDVSQAIGGSRERITAGVDFMDAIANAASNQFVSDSLIGTGPYKAIVLRVEKDNKTAEAGSWLSNTLSSFFGDAPKIVKIKARIPEIHAALPIPEQTGDAPGPHQPIIDLYPTFIAQDTQIEAPKPGDIVNVDFGNKNTYSDPIYLGPLIKTAFPPGAAGGIGGAGVFGNCGASSPIPATPAAQPSASPDGIFGSLDKMLELAGPSPPSVPASACIGTVGGTSSGGFGSGGASTGKSFGVDPTPFNGGKEGVIIINGNEYPLAKAKGSQQFKGKSRKGVPTFVVIHNSAGSGGEEGVFESLLSKGYGTHFTIGLDGTIYQHADPITQILYHASGLNTDSIGIETPAPYKWKTAGSVQKEAGFTNAGASTWYGSSVFAIPPQQMIDSMNQLLATLSSKIPSITPFLSTFPDNYIGPENLKKRKTDFGVKMYNKGGSWSHPKPNLGTWGGSIIAHRDWVAKADGRYFLEKFYEYYTGNKLDGTFK